MTPPPTPAVATGPPSGAPGRSVKLCPPAYRGGRRGAAAPLGTTLATSHDILPASAPRWRLYYALTKPRVVSLLVFTTVAAMFVAAKGWPGLLPILLVSIGGYMAAGAANTFNMVYERDLDLAMERTSHRPTVTHALTNAQSLTFGFALAIGSFALLWGAFNLLAAMMAMQYDNQGLAPLWNLVEAALLSPRTVEWLDQGPEPLLRLEDGEVRMALFDPAGWCTHYSHGQGDCDRLQRVYEHFLARQRQFAAVLEAHGIRLLYVHCDGASDARALLAAS